MKNQYCFLNITSLLDSCYKHFFDDNAVLNPLINFIKTESALDMLFSNNNEIDNELEKYLKENTINKNVCPLIWWAKNGVSYPRISKMARKYLCIPSTSTPSERVFSTAQNIITAKRNCLFGETAKVLIFLSHNSKMQ